MEKEWTLHNTNVYIYSRFASSSEAFVSKLLENIENKLNHVLNLVKRNTRSRFVKHELNSVICIEQHKQIHYAMMESCVILYAEK